MHATAHFPLLSGSPSANTSPCAPGLGGGTDPTAARSQGCAAGGVARSQSRHGTALGAQAGCLQVVCLRSNADHPGVTSASLLACKGTGEPHVSWKKAAISWWRGLGYPMQRGWCRGSPCQTMPIPIATLTCGYTQLQPASLQPSAFSLPSPLWRHNLQKIELVYLNFGYELSCPRSLTGELRRA